MYSNSYCGLSGYTLRSFDGVPTDPECTSGGPFDRTPGTNFACNIPASRLTDGVLGESSPANFNSLLGTEPLTCHEYSFYFLIQVQSLQILLASSSDR